MSNKELFHSGDVILDEDTLLETYNTFKQKTEIKPNSDDFLNFMCSLGGLGKMYMQKGDFDNSLKYYLEANEISNGKDFNVLFNLGVIYKNKSENEKMSYFLEKAQKINPDDQNLKDFINNGSNILNNESQNSGYEEELNQLINEKTNREGIEEIQKIINDQK